MQTHSTQAPPALLETTKAQGTLKQNFESALGELRGEVDPSASSASRHQPIVPRNRGTGRIGDGKTHALALAASALATLWGI